MRKLLIVMAVMFAMMSCEDQIETTEIAGTVLFQSTNAAFANGRLLVIGYQSKACLSDDCDEKLLEFEIRTDENGAYSFMRESKDVDYFEINPDILSYFGDQSAECAYESLQITAGSGALNFDIVLDCEVN